MPKARPGDDRYDSNQDRIRKEQTETAQQRGQRQKANKSQPPPKKDK